MTNPEVQFLDYFLIVKILPCKYRLFFQIAFLLLVVQVSAQTPIDSLSLPGRDSVPVFFRDSAVVNLNRINISNDALDDAVDYNARDSMWFDVKNKQVHLYGEATVKYTTLNIKAGYILLDYGRNEISANQFPDSTGQLAGLPDFKDAEQAFTATKLRYNFKTKKGIIYEARTKQEDLFVLGERAKFIGSTSTDTTLKARNTIYNSNAIITTCDHEHPHYGIRTKKLKVIPNKLVVTGLSNLEIGGIPTPFILPFGFFPITQTRKAGVIIPRDFEFADQEGFGIKDFGWYQPISEHMDVTTIFNAYTSGSWGVTNTARYNQRYRYNGDFQLRFNNRIREDNTAKKISSKSFGIRWTHNQDPKAHPTRRFGGSVNIETNRDQNRNRNDYASVYQNTLSSNLTYSKTFPGKPFQFNAGLRHSQNTQTRVMDISLPSATFTMQRIFPFKQKERIGNEKWFEKISLTYSSRLENQFRTVDTLLFTRKTLETARMGIQHQASTDFNFKVFKYVNIAPRLDFKETWYPYSVEKQLLPESRLQYDTTFEGTTIVDIAIDSANSQFGIDTTFRRWGLNAAHEYNAGISINTTPLFFTKQFKKGWFRGIRHTIKPAVSVGFGPDFTNSRYFRTVETDLRPAFNDTLRYSIFEDAVFGGPSTGGRDVALNYTIINVLEIKHRTRSDSLPTKKVRIFDNLGFSGNYSLTRDTLQWSTISTGGLFRLFKGVINLTWSATFDPYIANEKGQRVNRYMLRENGKLLRTTSLGFQVNTGFTVSQLRGIFSKKQSDEVANTPRNNPNASKDDLLGWFDNWRVNHRISFDRRLIPTGFGTARDTLLIGTNNVSFAGSIPLTSKWSLDLNNISYDFPSKSLVYPDIGITRDLHCWQLSLSWQPTRGTYSFFIAVKPGTLDFIKVPYRKNNFDASF
jgi:LptD protein